jgi:5-methylcytosine-specific restriction endonuclease McrA
MAAKKCSKCGEEKPLEQFYKFKLGKFGRQAECKVCSDARRRAFAATRPEAERESRRQWCAKNPEATKAIGARKRAKPEHAMYMKEYGRRWYADNRERLKPIRAKWHAENYATKRKPLMVQNQANRRARLRNAGGSHTLEQVLGLYEKQEGRCACCSQSLSAAYHRDHIVPIAAGGSNGISNIQLLCPPCNLAKRDKSWEEFLKTRSLNKEDKSNGRRRRHSPGMV